VEIALWIVAGSLAAAYLAAGSLKVIASKETLLKNPNMRWAEPIPAYSVKMIGFMEILGAIGLIMPQATTIAQPLTPAAAIGLAILQVGAITVHAARHEYRNLPINALCLIAAVFVAVGRL
jgi:uncharacterized membrane protein